MPRPLTRPLRRVSAGLRTRRGLRGTAVGTIATVAAALLTAGSQAPGPAGASQPAKDDTMSVPGGFVTPDTPLPDVPSQGDGSYHVELPPLQGVSAAEKLWGEQATKPSARQAAAEAGLPASVFAAYRQAADSVGRTDPGCHLRWELLAAIGKVESGHAGGGAVAANGDTLTRITGPALNGNGFALILDTENGVWDGDTVYDRAVGPMQFLPGSWKAWGADGNGDGIANPNNIYDAALAAGHYLCAGDRDLGTVAGLERAILSYNYSRDYLNLVLGWMEFYLRGVHTVPDGKGVVPRSPGAGSETPATEPVHEGSVGSGGKEEGGDGRGETAAPGGGPTPSPTASTGPKPRPSLPPSASPSSAPAADPTPSPTETTPEPVLTPPSDTAPAPEPTTTPPTTAAPEQPTDTATPTPTQTPEPEPTPTDTTTPAAEGTSTTEAAATPTG
ncbi:lytic transglycosylase domain-containing protein [Streptomyces sp. NPDC001982]|uniref:lytic transglycosylase domain-containing protein n=1 Tax=Streptomyces sp. NPDC001982 TaxID=3154405 RepID=UPI00331F380B